MEVKVVVAARVKEVAPMAKVGQAAAVLAPVSSDAPAGVALALAAE